MYASMTIVQSYLNRRPIPVRLRVQKPLRSESMTKEADFRTVLETRLITSIEHARYELITPLPLEIKCTDSEYIVKFQPIGIFAFGNDPEEAVAEFGTLFVDYYESLLRKEKSLAVNLRKELEILKQYLEKI